MRLLLKTAVAMPALILGVLVVMAYLVALAIESLEPGQAASISRESRNEHFRF